MTLAVTGALLAASLSAEVQTWQVAGALLAIGLGMGLSSSPGVVAVQSVVGWERRGVLQSTGPVADYARESLHAASHGVFVATAVTAAAVALMPRRVEPLVLDG